MKILYYIRGLNVGGAETFIYNILNNISSKYKIDIVLQDKKNRNKKLLKLCEDKNIKLYYITPFEKNIFKSIKELYKILKNNNYDILHIHLNALLNITPIVVGMFTKTKVIIHSHNTKNNLAGKIGTLIHIFNSKWINKQNITRLACGKEAGKWMYGKNKFYIINNAIDLEKFRFNQLERENLRKKMKISENEIIIGHVGRFVEAKNHIFILKIFSKILKKSTNYRLILIGNGDLENKIREIVLELNISEKVIIINNIQDTFKYYSLFDLLLFPSLFEGLPFVLVEAQASGLKIIASNKITEEMNIINSIEFIDLKNKEEYWSECILKKKTETKEEREKKYLLMKKSKYNIKYEVKKLEKIYDSI